MPDARSRPRAKRGGWIDLYFAPNWVQHDAPSNAGADREALKQVLEVIRGGFPDVRMRIDMILTEGDLVAYRGVAPIGKRVTLHQLNIDRVRDGKIVESWSESFGQGFHYQLTGKAPPVAAATR